MKRVLSLILAIVMVCMLIPFVPQTVSAASTYRINGVNVRYDNYTSSPSECWVYANNIYNKIWGEKFNNKFNDASNSLRNLSDSELTLTQTHLKEYVSNAELGACLRICNSKYLHGTDGWGHSQIIVQKDSNGFTVFEGGLSASPYCREKYYTWSEYINTSWLGGSYDYIKYIKWPDAPEYGKENSLVEKEYPAYCAIKVKTATTIKSLPCSEKSNAESKNVESASKNSQYQAIGLVKNTFGNLWYLVKTKSGTTGYMYAGDTTYIAQSIDDIKHSGITCPTEHVQGKSYVLTGKITSSYNKLTAVSAYIHKGNSEQGSIVTGDDDTVSGNSYTLKNSSIDSKTVFGKLTPGTYTYVVSASYKNYYATSATAVKSNTGTIGLYKSTFDVVKKATSCSHSYTSKITTNATCTTAGVRTYTCSKCSYSYTKSIDATGHSWKSASCTAAKTCSACGATSGSALGHSYGSWTETKAPTCTQKGSERRDCSRCNHYETRVVAATGHSWNNATCTTAKTCSTCGTTSGSALGHSYGSWTETKAPTCTQKGSERRDCSRCNHYETREVAATGHSWKSASCTAAKTCSTCGTTSGSALGHSYGSWTETKAPTCTQKGSERRDCSRCNHYETREVAATGHSWNNATCTTAKTCSTCGTTSGSALGHSYGNWTETKAPTCTQKGSERRDCSRCDHYETRVVAATGHTYTAVVTAPSCTAQGYTTHTCHCGDSYVDSYIAALGHNHVKATIAPTYTHQGYDQYVCDRCGDHYEKNYTDPIGLPTPVLEADNDTVSGKPVITWEADGEADYYEVYRSTSKTKSYKCIDTTEDACYFDETASSGKTYYYKVKAICIDDESLNSGLSAYRSAKCLYVQPEITEVTTNSSGYPKIKWSKIKGAKKYQVYYSTEEDGEYKRLTTTSSTSYTYTKAKRDTEYFFKVRAYGSSSSYVSDFSEVASGFRTLARPSISLSTSQSDRKVTIKWKSVSKAIGYELQCSINGGEFETIAEGNILKFVHTDLAPGNEYTYRLRALSDKEETTSRYSSKKSSTINVGKPTLTVTRAENGKPQLTWEEVEGAVEYQIYYATSKKGKYKRVETTEELSFLYEAAKSGKTYYFKVRAVDINGNKGSYSSVKSIKSK